MLAPADQSLGHGGAALQTLAAVHEAEALQCLVLFAAALVCQVQLDMQPMLAAALPAAEEAAADAAAAAAALKHSCPEGALAGAACADVAAAAAAADALVDTTALFVGTGDIANEAWHAHSVAAAAAALAGLIAMQQHTVCVLPAAAH